MLPWDPSGKTGPKKPQPDVVKVLEPKEEEEPAQISKPTPAAAATTAAAPRAPVAAHQ